MEDFESMKKFCEDIAKNLPDRQGFEGKSGTMAVDARRIQALSCDVLPGSQTKAEHVAAEFAKHLGPKDIYLSPEDLRRYGLRSVIVKNRNVYVRGIIQVRVIEDDVVARYDILLLKPAMKKESELVAPALN